MSMSAGAATLDVRATGSMRNPQVAGQATLGNVRLDYRSSRFDLVPARKRRFSRNVCAWRTFREHGLGRHPCHGHDGAQNARLRGINLQLAAKGIRIPYPKDFRSTVDAELSLRGSPESQV